MTTPDLTLRLSPHFRLRELCASGAAVRLRLDNTPSPEHVRRLTALCQNVLEPLRRRFGQIRITSGYRCPALNQAVGGVPTSQHMLGEAADLHISNWEVGRKMFRFIRDNTDFDQLLFERVTSRGLGWIHVSHRSDRGHNRHDARDVEA